MRAIRRVMSEKEFVPNTVNIPRDLHRLAKVEAAKEGVTLQAWIIGAIRSKFWEFHIVCTRCPASSSWYSLALKPSTHGNSWSGGGFSPDGWSDAQLVTNPTNFAGLLEYKGVCPDCSKSVHTTEGGGTV